MLVFNTQFSKPEANVEKIKVDPEELMYRLRANGLVVLDVFWEEFGNVKLPVEDDVIFLCEAYESLPSFVQNGGEHSVFLGDGALRMVATREGNTVHLVCTRVPFLHRGLLTTKEYTVTLNSYVSAWYRLIRALVELGDRVDPSGGS
jgi:hypothetical protein